MVADLLSPSRCHWKIAKVKNYNLNVTEVRDSDFKNAFSRNFQFHRRDPTPRLILTQLTFQNRLTLIFNPTHTEILKCHLC